jgi:hypothetical protein
LSEPVVRAPLDDEACLALIVTAIESPFLRVWCRAVHRAGGVARYELVLSELGRSVVPAHSLLVDPIAVRSAVELMLRSPARGYRKIAAAALVGVGEVDGPMADCIVQHAVFGEAHFG